MVVDILDVDVVVVVVVVVVDETNNPSTILTISDQKNEHTQKIENNNRNQNCRR